MKRISAKAIVQKGTITLLAACLLMTLPALGQSGGDYVVAWSTIDGGGGKSSGGPHVLVGTIGQPDAAYSTGGNYELQGGFLVGEPACPCLGDLTTPAGQVDLQDLDALVNILVNTGPPFIVPCE